MNRYLSVLILSLVALAASPVHADTMTSATPDQTAQFIAKIKADSDMAQVQIAALTAQVLAAKQDLAKVSAQASTTPSAPVAVPAEVAPEGVLSSKDALLHFILTKADKYSGKIEDGIGKAVDEIERETPGLVKEWLRWRFIENAFYFIEPILVAIILGLVALFCLSRWKAALKARTDPDGWIMGTILPAIFSVIMVAGGVCINMDNLLACVQIVIAPRIYVIEHVLKLMGKG